MYIHDDGRMLMNTLLSLVINVLYFGVATGCTFMCLLITLLVLLRKKELVIYETHRSILVFEALLLIIGFFVVLGVGIEILTRA